MYDQTLSYTRSNGVNNRLSGRMSVFLGQHGGSFRLQCRLNQQTNWNGAPVAASCPKLEPRSRNGDRAELPGHSRGQCTASHHCTSLASSIDDELRACMLIRFQSAIKDCPETSLRIYSAAGYWRVSVLFDPRANED